MDDEFASGFLSLALVVLPRTKMRGGVMGLNVFMVLFT